MNNYKDVIVLKRILNFSDIVENVYSVVESELFWWAKLLLLVYLIAIANRMNEQVIGMLCNRIASFYAKYQAVFAVEKEEKGIQLHVVINAFSFADGEVLHIYETGLQKLILFCVPFLPRCTIK